MSKPPVHSLGRRLLPAVAMTAAASGLIALLDRPSSGIAGTVGGGLAAGGASTLPDQGSASGQGQPPAVSSTLPALGSGNNPAPTVPLGDDGGDTEGQPVQPVATTTAPPATPTVAPASGGACQGKTVDGPSVNTRWGPVQVEAVVSANGQICDVAAIRSPNDRRRSISINQAALPLLHDQVMTAQSAKIRGVSGATVTSDGYVTSLQAILDGTAG